MGITGLPVTDSKRRSVPVTILGGSDRQAGPMPVDRNDLHAITTYKGVAIRIEGRPLIELLVERLRAADGLGPIAVAGPARVYGPLGMDAELIDTDGTVAENAQAAFDHHRKHGGPLGVLACDVLPGVAELELVREAFGHAPPSALFFPFVPIPEDPAALGASGYKPSYRLLPNPGEEPVRILPGHLGVCRPELLRLPLLTRLFDAAYRTRNRGIAVRRTAMLRSVLGSLVARDVMGLAKMRAPILTAQVVGSGLRLARRLRTGELELHKLERLIARILCRRSTDLGVQLPLLDLMGLATDVDTEEEAHELGKNVTIVPFAPPGGNLDERESMRRQE